MLDYRAIGRKTLPYVVAFALGAALAWGACVRNANDRVQMAAVSAQAAAQQADNEIKRRERVIREQETTIDSLEALRSADSAKRALERLKTIPEPRVDALEEEILQRGPALFGPWAHGNSRRALIASYGAAGVSEVELSRRVMAERKVIEVQVAGIAQAEREIRVNYEEALRIAADKCKKPNAAVAAGGGFVVGALLILLLL